MKKNNHQIVDKIKKLILQSQQQLQLNQDQTEQRVLFDTLVALDKSSKLLNTAWQVSQSNDLAFDEFRNELVDTFTDFADFEKKLKKDLKYKH